MHLDHGCGEIYLNQGKALVDFYVLPVFLSKLKVTHMDENRMCQMALQDSDIFDMWLFTLHQEQCVFFIIKRLTLQNSSYWTFQ